MINPNISLEEINKFNAGCMVSHIGIIFTDVGTDFLSAKMLVDERSTQPHGVLHGGASVTLAETLGSVAATLTLDNDKKYAAGLDINANHIRAVKAGNWVFGRANALHIGRKTQVWEIKITSEENKLVCISRLTVAILDK